MKIHINGVNIIATNKWIPVEEREPDKHYYHIRHSDRSIKTPSTIEKSVLVNFWGMAIADKPLDEIESGGYIELKRHRKPSRAS